MEHLVQCSLLTIAVTIYEIDFDEYDKHFTRFKFGINKTNRDSLIL